MFQTMPIFGMSRDHNRKRVKTWTEWIVSKTFHSVRDFRRFLLWSRDIPNMGVNFDAHWTSGAKKGSFEVSLVTDL